MKRTLVIDDEEPIRNLLKKMLENAGYEVDTAEDGTKGLFCIRNRLPDLVICDIVMPGKEGLETIAEIRKKYPGVKIIAISGGGKVDAKDYLLMAKGMGASKTISKPFRYQHVIETVEELLT